MVLFSQGLGPLFLPSKQQMPNFPIPDSLPVPSHTFLQDVEKNLSVSAQGREGDRFPRSPCLQVYHLHVTISFYPDPFSLIPE